jgi:hypothetical protein
LSFVIFEKNVETLKSVIVISFILLVRVIGAQSKKEQIQILNDRLDSLKTVQTVEKRSFETKKNELIISISVSDNKNKELSNSLSSKKEILQSKIEENKKLDENISSVVRQLNTIKDSIQKIINQQPIKLLHNGWITISDEEIIQLMNVKDEDLGSEFINEESPEIKPTYEIIGKQFFQLKGRVFCFVAMGVTNPNTAHVHYGANYLKCFEVKKDNWILLHPSENIEISMSNSGYGNPAQFDKFILFGDQNLAIILEGGYEGMGFIEGHRKIYGLDKDNRIQLIYKGRIIENDMANENDSMFQNLDDEYEISFKRLTNYEYYDLIETKKSHGKTVKTKILKFNENTKKYE